MHQGNCGLCGRGTHDLRRMQVVERALFLVVYVNVTRREVRGCPRCLRRHVVRRAFANLPGFNLLWPLMWVIWSGQILSTYLPSRPRTLTFLAHIAPAILILGVVLLLAFGTRPGWKDDFDQASPDVPDWRSARTPATRARATVDRLLSLARADDAAAAAPWVAYRGSDPQRRWKDVCDPTRQEELRHVTGVLEGIRAHQARGAPEFVSFETAEESEGEWLAWTVRFGDGPPIVFACLEIDGVVVLGDID